MPHLKSVIVGMSGGVDSTTTAYLLKKEGFHVEGVSFLLYEARLRRDPSYRHVACCSLEAIKEASYVAGQIGIPHTIVDLRDEFIEKVINPFIEAYKKGLTPNPCILCNRYIKFPYLLKIADEKGADFISTGHYARVMDGSLLKGIDPKKDQSYFLYVLDRKTLQRLILPLGGRTKAEVREIARSAGLIVAKRPESQEICFIEEKRYSEFITKILEPDSGEGTVEGPIIDIETGRVLKTHKGIFHYTIGQRRGLGISSKSPLYVIKIDPAHKALYVGRREYALRKEILVGDLNWIEPITFSGEVRVPEIMATVKIRSTTKDVPAKIYIEGDRARVVFHEPQWAPAPGQSAVFYAKEVVLGGGVIESLS